MVWLLTADEVKADDECGGDPHGTHGGTHLIVACATRAGGAHAATTLTARPRAMSEPTAFQLVYVSVTNMPPE